MQKIKDTTAVDYFTKLKQVVPTLTQDQINACAWVMGGSGCGWTKEGIADEINRALTFEIEQEKRNQFA